jgi:integrase
MSDLFKVPVIEYWLENAWIDAEGNPCDQATPRARFKERYRVRKGTPGAKIVRKKSSKWYARVNGKPIPLSANKEAARIMLGERFKKSELQKAGAIDRFEEHSKTPLLDHLAAYISFLGAKMVSAKQCGDTRSRITAILDGCLFVYPPDLTHSRLQEFLADLQRDKRILPPLPDSDVFTKREAAAALQISKDGFLKLVRAHKLSFVGEGRQRRYPCEGIEYLWQRANRGASIQTGNHYLNSMKAFARWMVNDRRMADNPLIHISRGNVNLDRRHDRRPLSLEEIRLVIQTALQSNKTFRELTGPCRATLYAVACVTGFRASELAELCPSSFDLDGTPPTATLPATATKNDRTATQPLPLNLVETLRDFLAAKPAEERLWPGTWHADAAEMLRIDLDAAGIPYVTDGPDGPLFADFHGFGRHGYVAMLDQSGATLKEAMQLARHSDPKLTAARYGRMQIHDLGEAVNRLPSLVPAPQAEKAILQATGTDSNSPLALGLRDGRDSLTPVETAELGKRGGDGPAPGQEVLILQGFESERDVAIPAETNTPDRSRTCNLWLRRPLLYPVELRVQPLKYSHAANFRQRDPRPFGISRCRLQSI